MFYLADKSFAIHTLITLLGLGWALLVRQGGLAGVLVLLWLLALVMWLEWRNGDIAQYVVADRD